MTRQEFETRLRCLVERAENELENIDNAIDLRAHRFPYDPWNDSRIFCAYPPDYDEIWNFVKNSNEWYVDIYENFLGENCAEFMDIAITSQD